MSRGAAPRERIILVVDDDDDDDATSTRLLLPAAAAAAAAGSNGISHAIGQTTLATTTGFLRRTRPHQRQKEPTTTTTTIAPATNGRRAPISLLLFLLLALSPPRTHLRWSYYYYYYFSSTCPSSSPSSIGFASGGGVVVAQAFQIPAPPAAPPSTAARSLSSSSFLVQQRRRTVMSPQSSSSPSSSTSAKTGAVGGTDTVAAAAATASTATEASGLTTISCGGGAAEPPATGSAPSGSASIPNWRTLPKPDPGAALSDAHRRILQHGGQQHGGGDSNDANADDNNTNNSNIVARPLWSDAAYRDSLALYDKLLQCSDDYVRAPIAAALQCLDHALRLYGPASTVCSFNGGKDAVVILHLVRAAVAHHYREQQEQQQQSENHSLRHHRRCRPRVVYFEHAHEFPEILDFLHATVERHDLDMIAFAQGTKFQDGLRVLVDHNAATAAATADSSATAATTTVKLPMAFVLGTRLTDPNAVGQQQFAPSSHYMPPFMRVNPVLDWTYGHVWHFLRLFQLDYCCLYDRGYTSLGTVRDTVPCPALAVPGNGSSGTSVPKYWPAYMLGDWDQERAGRLTKQQVAAAAATKQRKQLLKRQPSAGGGDTESLTARSETEAGSIGHLSTMSAGRRVLPSASDDDEDAAGDDTISDDDDEQLPIPSSVSYSSSGGSEIGHRQKSAALLIIGDEILKGFTADTNTQEAAAALRENNVLLKCVSVVRDDPGEIAAEIRRLQRAVDVIITSGGVGPTHDDVTLKSVAAALHCEMRLHDEMAQLLRQKMNGTAAAAGDGSDEEPPELTEAQQKMATLPTYSKLRYLSDDPDDWPVLQVKNLFILPGIPEYFKAKISSLGEYLGCQLERSFRKVVLRVDENSIVPVLNQVVEHHPGVVIGSYPFVSHPEYKTVITVEARLVPAASPDVDGDGDDGDADARAQARSNSTVFDRARMLDAWNGARPTEAAVQMALDELIHSLPAGSVLRVESDDMNLFS